MKVPILNGYISLIWGKHDVEDDEKVWASEVEYEKPNMSPFWTYTL